MFLLAGVNILFQLVSAFKNIWSRKIKVMGGSYKYDAVNYTVLWRQFHTEFKVDAISATN
jgi:hypothetical protein